MPGEHLATPGTSSNSNISYTRNDESEKIKRTEI